MAMLIVDLGVLTLLAVWVRAEPAGGALDRRVAAALQAEPPSLSWSVAGKLAFLGTAPVALLLGQTLALLAWRRFREPALVLFSAMVPPVAIAAGVVLKEIVARRPSARTPLATYDQSVVSSLAARLKFSFPSGHATAVSALVFVAVAVVFAASRRRRTRVWCLLGAAALVVVVSGSRIVIGVHDFSDVVAGWLTASAVALGLALVVHRTGRGRLPQER